MTTNPKSPEAIAEELALKHLPEMWRYPKGKPVDYNRVYREHAKTAILDAMRIQREQAWIPVSERLPDDSDGVLVAVSGHSKPIYAWHRDMRYHNSKRAAEWETYTRVLHHVTHWMPLPDMPSGELSHEP